jgi:hypothetical protein
LKPWLVDSYWLGLLYFGGTMEPDGIYMIRHYTYDGCGRHDQYDVQYAWKYETALGKLKKWQEQGHFDDYEWEHWDSLDDLVLLKREGQYAYDYYFIQFMAPGEDID